MLTIGLTGGIGSGKSTVANFFQELGIDVIDSDKLAHQLTETFQPAYFEIIKKFGNQVITKEGHLNRKALREIIFKEPTYKKWLEELLHPLIKQKIIEELTLCSSAYVIIVVPLLVEAGMTGTFERILVVDSPMAKQLERTLERDKANEELILQIMSSQATKEQRLAVATDIIVNDKNLANLKNAVENLHYFYLRLASEYSQK